MSQNSRERILLILVTINCLPHVQDLPLWVNVVMGILLSWRWLTHFEVLPTLNRWLTGLLAIALTSFLYSDFGTLIGAEAATPMFILMVLLKLFELKRERDVVLVTMLCYLLLMN